MGPNRSKIKKTRKSIMKSTKGESRHYAYAAVLGICIACLPFLVAASQLDERHGSANEEKLDLGGDLDVAESQHLGAAQRSQPQTPQLAVPTSPIPVAVPPPGGSPSAVVAPPPAGFTIPKSDLASAPSYAPRYAVPPVSPWKEQFPFEVQQFRRRATDDDAAPTEDDYQPQESKGKKHSPSVLKRVRNSIRNTGKAIVGAPSYILKRYRGTWKKYFGGGGGKKKKGGWKAWSPSTSDKNDGGWGGWEETEPAGGYYDEPSHYPTDKGWKSSSKGYSKGYDSHERRSDRDRESTSYRDYRERDNNRDYDSPPPRPTTRTRPERGDRAKQNSSYREETHYDDYDGRRTTAYYGPSSRKSSKRPGGSSGSSSGNYRYDDDY